MQETLTILSDMEHFWMRFNNATIDCACLADEKSVLKQQNRNLKNKLKMYLTNVTLTQGSGGSPDEQLRPKSMRVDRCGASVNGYAQEVLNGGESNRLHQRRRPVTCIEGNLSQAVRSRSLVEPRVRMPDVYALVFH